MNIKFKKLLPQAIKPTYGTSGAACFDLYCINEGSSVPCFVARTGLAVEVPMDHVMLIFSRSGHGFKNNVRLANCVGVIDSDYRGEIIVKIFQDGEYRVHPFYIKPGDRIAQGMIIPAYQWSFEEVKELSSTDRGEGGFGSTGR